MAGNAGFVAGRWDCLDQESTFLVYGPRAADRKTADLRRRNIHANDQPPPPAPCHPSRTTHLTMRQLKYVSALAVSVAAAALFTGCDSSNVVDPPSGGGDSDISVPSFYAFQSRFADTSSVEYSAAVVHNLLAQDVILRIDQAAEAGAPAASHSDLMARYTGGAGLAILTSTNPAPEATNYEEVTSPPALADLLAGSPADQPLLGRGETADEVIRAYLEEIAMNTLVDSVDSAAVYTTAEGIDMKRTARALLLGAAIYAQGTGRYLSTDALAGAGRDEQPGEPATELAQLWDLAFGYFGAARRYAGFSDENLADGLVYIDANRSGGIDFTSEYNFAFAEYAGARDAGASGVNFTKEIFDGFLRGRTTITNGGPLEEILAHRDRIRAAWERALAAGVVHFLNGVTEEMGTITREEARQKSDAALNSNWSSAKGFSYALQFNPARAITDAELMEMHALLGEAPPYAFPDTSAAADSLRSNMQAAKNVLQDVYAFSNGNVFTW